MGEDIHISTYVKSKVENKYINAFNLTTSPQYFQFKPFFEGRYYDLFSLFGSQRSDMKPLENANYGVPDFVNPTYSEYLQKMGYYGFIWFNIMDLKKSIEKYISKLKDPKLYFDDEDDDIFIEQIKSGTFNTRSWKREYATPLTYTLTSILENIKNMLNDDFSAYKDLLELDQTVFIIYFDC